MQMYFCIVKANAVSLNRNTFGIPFQPYPAWDFLPNASPFAGHKSVPSWQMVTRKPQGKTNFQPKLLLKGHSFLSACTLLCSRINETMFPCLARSPQPKVVQSFDSTIQSINNYRTDKCYWTRWELKRMLQTKVTTLFFCFQNPNFALAT